MICLATGGEFGGGQGVSHVGGSLSGRAYSWEAESCGELRLQARSLGQGTPESPTQPSRAQAITHTPFSTLTERTLRRPPRSQMFAQSLSSRQRRPWKSSSSQSVRQAGAGPGAGALLMPLRQEGRDQALSVSRAPSPAQARPTRVGDGGPGAGPGLGWARAASGSPSSRPPCPEKTLPEHRVFTGWVSAVLTENGEAARGPGMQGFIPSLSSLPAPSPAEVGRAESAGSLRSARCPLGSRGFSRSRGSGPSPRGSQ